MFSKNHQMSRKSVQWEPSCSTQTDRRVEEETGMTQLTVAFRNVVSALKNENNFWLRVFPSQTRWTNHNSRMILLTDSWIFAS